MDTQQHSHQVGSSTSPHQHLLAVLPFMIYISWKYLKIQKWVCGRWDNEWLLLARILYFQGSGKSTWELLLHLYTLELAESWFLLQGHFSPASQSTLFLSLCIYEGGGCCIIFKRSLAGLVVYLNVLGNFAWKGLSCAILVCFWFWTWELSSHSYELSDINHQASRCQQRRQPPGSVEMYYGSCCHYFYTFTVDRFLQSKLYLIS